MGYGGIASASTPSPSPVAGHRGNSRAASAGAAISVALILLYVIWRFVWQSKKHPSTNDGLGAASSSVPRLSPSAACGATIDAEFGGNERAQLPVFVHLAPPGATECAVCLAEFAHGEAGRLVPGCGHGFHAACIETWLRVRSTCPLCRAAVVEEQRSLSG
jgi:hypothetical protein